MMTNAPRPRLVYTAIWFMEAALVGSEVGVGRGVSVGVGEAATRKGVGNPISSLFGVGVTRGVGVVMGVSFCTFTGTMISCNVPSSRKTRNLSAYSPSVTRVVSQTAKVESVTGWVEVWRANQVSVGLEAYEKSSWEELNPKTSVVPVMTALPWMASPEDGDVIAIGGVSCAARRSRVRSRKMRIFIKLTDKFNMKDYGQSNFALMRLQRGVEPCKRLPKSELPFS